MAAVCCDDFPLQRFCEKGVMLPIPYGLQKTCDKDASPYPAAYCFKIFEYSDAAEAVADKDIAGPWFPDSLFDTSDPFFAHRIIGIRQGWHIDFKSLLLQL